jgi:hypothetical protein
MPSGSINKLSLGGIPFDVAGDADFTEVFTKFVNSMIRTSGRSSAKQEARVPEVGGVVIIVKPGDKKILKDMANKAEIISISYVNRNGDKYKGTGIFNVESNTTMDNRTTVTLLPEDDWTETLAS